MTENYKLIESDLRQVIYDDAVEYFGEDHGNFIFNDLNPSTLLFALCLTEFYGVSQDRIFCRRGDKIYDITSKQIDPDLLSRVGSNAEIETEKQQ